MCKTQSQSTDDFAIEQKLSLLMAKVDSTTDNRIILAGLRKIEKLDASAEALRHCDLVSFLYRRRHSLQGCAGVVGRLQKKCKELEQKDVGKKENKKKSEKEKKTKRTIDWGFVHSRSEEDEEKLLEEDPFTFWMEVNEIS